jgi:hypothetical protein
VRVIVLGQSGLSVGAIVEIVAVEGTANGFRVMLGEIVGSKIGREVGFDEVGIVVGWRVRVAGAD